MSSAKPEFHLRRVESSGPDAPPEVYPVDDAPDDTGLSRRGFLGTGLTMASLVGLLTVPQQPAEASEKESPGANSRRLLGRVSGVVYAHAKGINSIAISPDGKVLASGSKDATVKLWSLPAGKLLRVLTDQFNEVTAVAFTPDSKVVGAWSLGETCKFWSVPEGEFLQRLNSQRDSVGGMAITPDCQMLAVASRDNVVKLWRLADGKQVRTLQGHEDWVNDVAIAPDGQLLASASRDKTVRLWSLPDGKQLRTLLGHEDRVIALALALDGKLLASGSRDETVKLWSLPEGKCLATLRGHDNSVTALATTVDGKLLASGSWDRTVRLWSLPDGRPLGTLGPHPGGVLSVAFTPDGKCLASADSTGVIILWDLAANKPRSFLFDARVSITDAVVYNVIHRQMRRTVTYTLPCDAPVPEGAICVCNCVLGKSNSGTARLQVAGQRPKITSRIEVLETGDEIGDEENPRKKMKKNNLFPGVGGGPVFRPGGWDCTCNQICTCDLVYR